MNNRLDQFIRDNRDDFDDEQPSARIWEDISRRMGPAPKKAVTFLGMNPAKWSAAAAVAIILAGSLYFISQNSRPATQGTASSKPIIPASVPNSLQRRSQEAAVTHPSDTSPKTAPSLAKTETGAAPDSQDLQEEMYHFARLVEIRHKQLYKIKKDEPLLFKQFSGDLSRLDSVYHTLENQIPKNPNREQLLEAMIQNLQLQMDLLNHQLTIIQKINHSKKTAYEKAFKSA